MQIKMILATDLNGCIGYNNELIFKSKRDLKRFKVLTTNEIVVMGSKTYESLGYKPLPNRINVVLSNNINDNNDNNVHIYNNINTMLLDMLQYYPNKVMWIIGGANIYNQFIDFVDEIYLTQFFFVSDKCDTFVNINDTLDKDFFIKSQEDFVENDLNISFINYERG